MKEPGVKREEVEITVGRAFHLEAAPVGDDLALGLAVCAERDISLEAEFGTDDRPDQQQDDTVVGDDESGMLFLPGPAGERDGEEVHTEESQPGDEPRGLVDPCPRHRGIETRLREGGRGTGDGDRGKKEQGQLQRSKQMDQSPDG